jgi:hypothetical protein
MRTALFHPSETDRAELRLVVADIEWELSCLGRAASVAEHRAAVDALIVSWSKLLELMGGTAQVRPLPS